MDEASLCSMYFLFPEVHPEDLLTFRGEQSLLYPKVYDDLGTYLPCRYLIRPAYLGRRKTLHANAFAIS